MSFRIGDVVSDYEVIGRLGAGGMGEVYKVRNLISDRIEALKILLPDLQAAPELAERFIREIKVHASLQHANIAALHTALRVDNQLFMVLEYVEGLTIRELLSNGPVELSDGIDYIGQTLCALAYAHERGVTHRDIKPSNIMVTPARIVKLMDFGIASKADDNRLTRSGMAMGSVYYMSPEQVSAKPVDGRSDLYSIGVTLFQLVTGRFPFEGDNEYAIMSGHVQGKPVPPSHYNPSLPPMLSDIILRSLEKEPGLRFQNALEFRSALEAVRKSEGMGNLGLPRTPPPDVRTPQDATRIRPTTTPLGTPLAAPLATPSTGTMGQTPDPARLEVVRKLLAAYIGPIAGVLVTRASRKATTLEELYNQLAKEIPGSDDREKFLRAVLGSRR